MTTSSDRRRAFQETHEDLRPPQRNQWTILFGILPLALLLYVWDSVQEHENLNDPHYAILKDPKTTKNSLIVMEDNTTDDTVDVFDPFGFGAHNDDADTIDIPYTGIWIHVESWHEGMAGWKRALADVMVVAKRLKAVVVEPEIADGRLVACGKGKLRLSNVFNRTLLEKFHGPMATCSKFQTAQNQLTAPTIVNVCMEKKSPQTCWTSRGEELDSDYQKTVSAGFDQALAHFRANPDEMVILNIHGLWMDSMDKIRLLVDENHFGGEENEKRAILMDKEQSLFFHNHHYRFLESHYSFLQTQLELNGIGDYAVIHWRAELPEMNYEKCANQIWETREAMKVKSGVPFFLMSSLSANEDDTARTSWTGANDYAQQNKTAYQAAMKSLLEWGDTGHFPFKKIENILPPLEDSILYAVMDLILAEKALEFSTCSDRCKHHRFGSCRECNFIGKFAKAAMTLRGKDNPYTYPCWPVDHSELAEINDLWNKS